MMKEQKTSPWMRCKSLYILPLSLVALCAFATPEETVNFTEITPPKKVAAPTPVPTQSVAEPKAEPVVTAPAQKEVQAPAEEPAETTFKFPKVKDLDDVLLVAENLPVSKKELKKIIKEYEKIGMIPYVVLLNKDLKNEVRKLGVTNITYCNEESQERCILFLNQLYHSNKATKGAVILTVRNLSGLSFDDALQKAVSSLVTFNNFTTSVKTEEVIIQAKSTSVNEFKPGPGTFTINGTVSEGLRDVAYLVHIADEDGDIREKPSAVILVKDGKFSYSTQLEKPTTIRIRAVFEDGSICSAWIENKYLPNTTANITVMNGTYSMTTTK